MAIQSLMLISQYNLPIKVIILNNASLGMITQFQHLYFDDRMCGTTLNGATECRILNLSLRLMAYLILD